MIGGIDAGNWFNSAELPQPHISGSINQLLAVPALYPTNQPLGIFSLMASANRINFSNKRITTMTNSRHIWRNPINLQ